MSQELTDREKQLVREKIQEKYAQVAAIGAPCCFRYPTGEEGLRLQKYPLELIQDFPKPILESFCGVGNPFSLGPLYRGEAVLDIGCGAGFDALLAARLVGPEGRVVGLDVTPEMLARAKENQALLGLTNVNFQVGDAEVLSFPDHDFDVVISNGAVNLTLDKEKVLKEVHRVLKPGGRCMMADMVLVEALPADRAGKIDNWYQ